MGERRALFGQKYRQNSSFCDSVVFYSVIETGKKSQKLRGKRYLFKKILFLGISEIEKRRRNFSQNLENREENENFFLKILKIEKRKRMD